MRANEYQTRAMSTRLPSCENATYMLFGLMAEIGEIADKIAKWRLGGVWSLVRIQSPRLVKIKELGNELSSFFFYI